jgi:hypothetical protein
MTGHPDTERLLARFECTFDHEPELDLRAIDLVASVLNQSRFEAIHADTVERYIAALHDGAVFPPIVLRRLARPDGSRQLVILGGNHRARAHIDAGRKTIDAYLVDCDDLTALELAYADNATHGLPPSDVERIAHVEVLVAQGRTVADAARTVGISRSRVDFHLNARAVEERARQLGCVDELLKLANATRRNLAVISEDRVFTKLVKTIAAHKIGAGPAGAQRLIADVNSQPDVASAMDYIALFIRDWEDRRHKATVGRRPENPYLQLRLALGQIKGLNAADVVDRCPTDRDREELHELLLAGARHLMAIDTLATAGTRPLQAVR